MGSRLLGPPGHPPRVFIQQQGQLGEELVHKEKRAVQSSLIN